MDGSYANPLIKVNTMFELYDLEARFVANRNLDFTIALIFSFPFDKTPITV